MESEFQKFIKNLHRKLYADYNQAINELLRVIFL
jgi:hypothetical protein